MGQELGQSMTEEQKETLRDLSEEQWKALAALARTIQKNLQEKVLNADVSVSSRGIFLAKARADGGSCIIDGIERAKAQLRKEK